MGSFLDGLGPQVPDGKSIELFILTHRVVVVIVVVEINTVSLFVEYIIIKSVRTRNLKMNKCCFFTIFLIFYAAPEKVNWLFVEIAFFRPQNTSRL